MRQIVNSRENIEVEKQLEVGNIKHINFEGLFASKRGDDLGIGPIFYCLNEQKQLIPLYVPMKVDENDNISDYHEVIIDRPIISNVLKKYVVHGSARPTANDTYLLPVMKEGDSESYYLLEVSKGILYYICYVLSCFFNNNTVNYKTLTSLHQMVDEEYREKKLSFCSIDDIIINKIFIDKDGMIFTLLDFVEKKTSCLFIAGLTKKKAKEVVKKAKDSDFLATTFEEFKEISIAKEAESGPVYVLEEPIIVHYTSKRFMEFKEKTGNMDREGALTKVVFVNHYDKTNITFLEFEFTNMVNALMEFVDKI